MGASAERGRQTASALMPQVQGRKGHGTHPPQTRRPPHYPRTGGPGGQNRRPAGLRRARPGLDIDFTALEQLAREASRGLTEGTRATLLQSQAQALGNEQPCPVGRVADVPGQQPGADGLPALPPVTSSPVESLVGKFNARQGQGQTLGPPRGCPDDRAGARGGAVPGRPPRPALCRPAGQPLPATPPIRMINVCFYLKGKVGPGIDIRDAKQVLTCLTAGAHDMVCNQPARR
jgi:hypothetical protein